MTEAILLRARDFSYCVDCGLLQPANITHNCVAKPISLFPERNFKWSAKSSRVQEVEYKALKELVNMVHRISAVRDVTHKDIVRWAGELEVFLEE